MQSDNERREKKFYIKINSVAFCISHTITSSGLKGKERCGINQQKEEKYKTPGYETELNLLYHVPYDVPLFGNAYLGFRVESILMLYDRNRKGDVAKNISIFRKSIFNKIR